MTEKDIAFYARQVAQRILFRQHGGMDDPQTWIEVACSFGCRVSSFYHPGGELGDYAPIGEGHGIITYNAAITPPAQAKVVVHELAHHLLMSLISGYLFGDFVMARYNDDPGDVRHRIARRVEDLCFRRL